MKRNRRLGLAFGVLAFAMAFCGVGCADEAVPSASPSVEAREAVEEESETPAPSPTETATEEPSAEPTYAVFGKDEDGALSVVLTNGTEQDIIGLRVRNSDNMDFGENLLPDGKKIVPTETFQLFIEQDAETGGELTESEASPEATDPAQREGADERLILFNETYDIDLTFADTSQAVLYDVSPKDIETGVIAYSVESNVAYLSYVSAENGETVNTLDAQIARSRDEQAAALEEKSAASATPTEEEKAASETKTKSPAADEGGTSVSAAGDGAAHEEAPELDNEVQDTNEDYDAPAQDDAGEPEQEIGECLEDNIIWND